MPMETGLELRSIKVMEERKLINKQLAEGKVYFEYRSALYKENIKYFQEKGLFITKLETENEEDSPRYLIKVPHLKEKWRRRTNQTNQTNQASTQIGMLLFIMFLLCLANQLLMGTFKF